MAKLTEEELEAKQKRLDARVKRTKKNNLRKRVNPHVTKSMRAPIDFLDKVSRIDKKRLRIGNMVGAVK